MRTSLLLGIALCVALPVRAEPTQPEQLPQPTRIPTEPRSEPTEVTATPAVLAIDAPPERRLEDFIRVEGIWLDRKSPSRINLSFFELSDRLALATDQLDFDSQIGVRVTRGYLFGEGHSVEASYFGLHRYDATRQVASSVNDLTSFFVSGFGPGTFLFDSFDQATTHEAFLRSELHSGELNWRKEWGWDHGTHAAVVVGARYLRLTEAFDFLSIDEPALNTGRYTVEATNNLIGPQLGGEFGCAVERARFGLFGRVGLLVNFARQDSEVFNANLLVRTGEAEETTLASMAEFGLFFHSRLGEHVEWHAGFHLLALGGLALAPEQLDFFSGVDSQQGIHVNGWTLYYGPTGGLLIRW